MVWQYVFTYYEHDAFSAGMFIFSHRVRTAIKLWLESKKNKSFHTVNKEPKADGAVTVQVWGDDCVASMIWELDVSESNLSVANTFDSDSIYNNLAESDTASDSVSCAAHIALSTSVFRIRFKYQRKILRRAAVTTACRIATHCWVMWQHLTPSAQHTRMVQGRNLVYEFNS